MSLFRKYSLYLILTLAGAFIIFLAVITATDYRPAEKLRCDRLGKAEGVLSADSTYTLQTWNLGYFGLGKNDDFFYDGGKMTRPGREDYDHSSSGVIDFVENSAKSDFYFFQEVDLSARRSYRDNQVKRLMDALPGYESWFAMNYDVLFVPMPVTNPMGSVKSGILTFSSLPSTEDTRIAFPGGYSWPVGLFMLDRCFILTCIKMPGGKDLVLINTHNEAFDNGSQRRQQMEVLREAMLGEYAKGNYVVAGGDWNQNPLGFDPKGFITGDVGRYIEPAIEADFLPAEWKWAFDPKTPTNRNVDQAYKRGSTPVTIIDFFVVSPNVEILEVKTRDLGFQWTDHQPVRMRFKLME